MLKKKYRRVARHGEPSDAMRLRHRAAGFDTALTR